MNDLLDRMMKISEDITDYPQSIINRISHQIEDVLANLEADLSEVDTDYPTDQLVDDIWTQVNTIVHSGAADDDVMGISWMWDDENEGSVKQVVDGIIDYIEEIKKDLMGRFGEDEMRRIFDAAWDVVERDMD